MFYKILQRDRKTFVGAACRGHPDPDIWHSEDEEEIEEARSICQGCSIRMECLSYAMSNDERFGMWGSLTYGERGVEHRTRF